MLTKDKSKIDKNNIWNLPILVYLSKIKSTLLIVSCHVVGPNQLELSALASRWFCWNGLPKTRKPSSLSPPAQPAIAKIMRSWIQEISCPWWLMVSDVGTGVAMKYGHKEEATKGFVTITHLYDGGLQAIAWSIGGWIIMVIISLCEVWEQRGDPVLGSFLEFLYWSDFFKQDENMRGIGPEAREHQADARLTWVKCENTFTGIKGRSK